MKKTLQQMLIGCSLALVSTATFALDLVAVSWGGAYATSQREAFWKPWMEKVDNKHKIIEVEYSGGNAEVRTQVESGNLKWDIVDNVTADIQAGCEEGLFEKIDYSRLAKGIDGSDPSDDFLLTGDCLVPLIVYATVAAYNKNAFPGEKPSTAADFFNLEKFPGKRSLRKKAQFTMEYTLVADGVPVSDVYKVLATEEGVQRVFDKLDTIKDQVVWWEAGAQGPQLLADGEVAIASSFNGRFFDAQVKDGQPFEIMWDGQLLEFDGLAVVKGVFDNAEKKEAIYDFLNFSSDSQRLANQAQYISYGPARKSSGALLGAIRHAEANVPVESHLPTATANIGNAVINDDQFWADNGDELNNRFNAWLASQ